MRSHPIDTCDICLRRIIKNVYDVECKCKIMCPLHSSAPQMREALKKAIELITAEYCSHPEPHSPMLSTCYAQDQLKALIQAETHTQEPT